MPNDYVCIETEVERLPSAGVVLRSHVLAQAPLRICTYVRTYLCLSQAVPPADFNVRQGISTLLLRRWIYEHSYALYMYSIPIAAQIS